MTTGDGMYEVHDYKTSATLPYEEYLKEDRQLALYALAILNSYQDAKDVKLLWHFLAFDKTIVLQKTQEELDKKSENQIKSEFIDTLFEALGWDMRKDAEREERVLKGRADYILKLSNQKK